MSKGINTFATPYTCNLVSACHVTTGAKDSSCKVLQCERICAGFAYFYVFMFSLTTYRLRRPLTTAAQGMRKDSKLWTPQILRSRPSNQSPRKPHHKSSRHPAHSPLALTHHQKVCLKAGALFCAFVHVRMDFTYMTKLDIRTCSLSLLFSVTTLTL